MQTEFTLSTYQLSHLAHVIVGVFEERGVVSPREPELLSYETAAKLLECCPETVRNLANRKEVKRVWIGTGTKGAPRITLTSLRAYIVNKTESSEPVGALQP